MQAIPATVGRVGVEELPDRRRRTARPVANFGGRPGAAVREGQLFRCLAMKLPLRLDLRLRQSAVIHRPKITRIRSKSSASTAFVSPKANTSGSIAALATDIRYVGMQWRLDFTLVAEIHLGSSCRLQRQAGSWHDHTDLRGDGSECGAAPR
jgi:hypothetical protein